MTNHYETCRICVFLPLKALWVVKGNRTQDGTNSCKPFTTFLFLCVFSVYEYMWHHFSCCWFHLLYHMFSVISDRLKGWILKLKMSTLVVDLLIHQVKIAMENIGFLLMISLFCWCLVFLIKCVFNLNLMFQILKF